MTTTTTTSTTSTTSPNDDLLDKGLAVIATAQHVALSGVQAGISTLKSIAPEAQDALTKLDVADARHLVDSAFDAAGRVVGQTRSFVGELLGVVFDGNGNGKPTTL